MSPTPFSPATNETEGHLGHLTPEENLKLQELWIHLLRLCGTDTSVHGAALSSTIPDRTAEWRKQYLTGHAQGHPHVHSHHIPAHESSTKPTGPRVIDAPTFRSLLWEFFLSDHPDVMLLRFLRARKWDMDKSMGMLLSAINWRHEQDIQDLVHRGDAVALSPNPSAEDKAFVKQYESGKAFVRGEDLEGRPVFVVQVRKHLIGGQSNEVMERFVLHSIETIRSMVRYPGGEKACLVFDLTGFGMKNMDFHVVKFLVTVFEARYPEHLGTVLVHNAPWLFWGCWKIIRPWLDPVIASKINFTSNNKDMAKHISQDNLIKCYGGKDTWEYKYIPPVEGENAKMEPTSANEEKKAKIRAERDELMQKFETTSLEWAIKGFVGGDAKAANGHANGHTNGSANDTANGTATSAANGVEATAEQQNDERFELAKKLHQNFWVLDPYIRARTPFHRCGMIGPGGEVAPQYKGVR